MNLYHFVQNLKKHAPTSAESIWEIAQRDEPFQINIPKQIRKNNEHTHTHTHTHKRTPTQNPHMLTQKRDQERRDSRNVNNFQPQPEITTKQNDQ